MGCPLLSLPSLALVSCALLAPACFAAPAKVAVATPSACPVELSAERGIGNGTLVATGPKATPPASRATSQQVFDLSMKNSRLQRIVAADLEVHGTVSRVRSLPVTTLDLTGGTDGDAKRNVYLTSSIPADQLRTHTLTVNDLTSITWISVIELRYADGSTWHAGSGRVCAVTPNAVMLVAAK